MSTSKEEADVVFNKANVALARSQRLIASWLPPVTEDELSNTKTEEQPQKEENEIFTAVPEKLGLGAPLPKKAADGSWESTELSSNDQLRKQLLGRNWEKMSAQIPVGQQTGRPNPSKPLPQETRNKDRGNSSSDDEEEGRSSLGKIKRKRTVQDQQNVDETSENKESTSATTPKRTGAKKTGSYLDEVLSQRKKKKKNKT